MTARPEAGQPRIRGRVAAVLLTVGIGGVLVACGGSPITPAPLETSISQSFARLYVRQQALQGDPSPSLANLHATASCQKGTQRTEQVGAGDDWACQVTFLVAGPSTPVKALYNVNVQTNGCFSADGDGPTSVNGSRTIVAADGQTRVNPLWLIDGCFDIG